MGAGRAPLRHDNDLTGLEGGHGSVLVHQAVEVFPLPLSTVLVQRPSPFLLFSEAIEGDKGAVLFKHACERNLEGIVSKRKGSPYISGPTTTWRKVKCPDRQGRGGGGPVTASGLACIRAGDRYPDLGLTIIG